MQTHQVHNSNPYKDSKRKFTSASASNVQPVKEKKPVNKHYGKFGKRMQANDMSSADAYTNSMLGSTLMRTYSISRYGRCGQDQGTD